MFRISSEQLRVFEEDTFDRFAKRVLGYLQQHYPGTTLRYGKDRIRELLRSTIYRVAKYQLTSEAAVVTCVELALTYGENFYTGVAEPTDPELAEFEDEESHGLATWAWHILHQEELGEEDKVTRLRTYIRSEVQ